MAVRIQIAFKTIRTPATEEFEQGKLKVKRILQQSNFTAQQVELITGMEEFKCFGNLRDFYCLQDHTTSNNKMGKDKAKDKEQYDGETATSSETITSPQDAHQSTRDLS